MQIDKIRQNGLSPLSAKAPALEKKTATQLEVIIEGKINRAIQLQYHSRDIVGAVVRVDPDKTLGWRVQVIAAPKSIEPFQIAAERIASELRAVYELKLNLGLGQAA